MKYDDITKIARTYFPDAWVDEDAGGQIRIQTGLYPNPCSAGSFPDIEYLPLSGEPGGFDFSYNPPLPPTVEEEDDLKGAYEDI